MKLSSQYPWMRPTAGPRRGYTLYLFSKSGLQNGLLNERQSKAWKTIRNMESVTCNEYQKIVGGRLPSRTAIYDLQVLVKSGKLHKTGRGPSTRYTVEK